MAELINLLSRRNLIIGMAGTAAAGATAAPMFLDPVALMQLLRPAGARRGGALKSGETGDWTAQRDTIFRLETGQVLKLTDVQAFKSIDRKGTRRPSGVRSTAFVARFDIKDGGPLVGDRIYRINHAQGGVFDIYLTTPDASKPLRVDAVFS